MTNMIVKRSIPLIVILLAMLLTTAGQAWAGGQNRAGTNAAPELLIPAGARYLAMGGAPVAYVMGVEAIYWNPAGLDRAPKAVNAMFSHRSYIADIAYNFLGVSGKFDMGTLALSLRSLSFGDIPVTTENAPDGTGELFSPTYFIFGLTYSRQLTDRISFGLTVNLVHEGFVQVNTTGFALDAGVQYRNVLSISGMDLGVVIKNIGPAMQYGGAGLWVPAEVPGSQRGVTYYKTEAASFDLPSVVEIGAAYRYTVDEHSDVIVCGTFQNNNFSYDEYRFGVEYSFDQKFFVRGGRLFGAGTTDETPNVFAQFTLGAGVNFVDVGGTDISIDYAFVPVKYFSNNHVISLKVGF